MATTTAETGRNTGMGEILRTRAAELVPVLRRRAAETERQRRLPDETFHDLRDAGIFKAAQPEAYGGYALPIGEVCDMVAEIGRGCGSSSWISGVYADHCVTVGMFSKEAQDEVWGAKPEAVIGSGLRPSGKTRRVDGGYRLSGTWRFSSGIDFADWIFAGSIVPPERDGGRPEARFFLFPRAEAEVADSWHVMALAGTGSRDFTLDELFVPEHRSISMAEQVAGTAPGCTLHDNPLYRLPHHIVACALAVPALGLAQGGIEYFLDALGGRETRTGPAAEFPTLQMRVAESSIEVDAARLLIRRDCDVAMARLAVEDHLDDDFVARCRGNKSWAIAHCVKAVDRLMSAAGVRALFQDDPLQRVFRDIHAVEAHFGVNWDACSTAYGRAAFGLDQITPFP